LFFVKTRYNLLRTCWNLPKNANGTKYTVGNPPCSRYSIPTNTPFFETDKDFEQAEVGFTLCEALIARNGSIMLSNANAAGRRLSIYPPVHIVLAYTSQLVLDLKDGFKLIKEKYADRIPSMITTVTGPSRTADIEKTLVLGAHGPKELFVFLLDG
jgi:L-lactate dehydrogenase complex protein LldG